MAAVVQSSARSLRAVVVPDLPLADAVRLTLATATAAMMYHEAAAIGGEIEPLHQMRVAARRLRATTQLFTSVIHGSRMRIYRRDLPWLGHAAGEVRECDVMEALIREVAGRLDPTLAGSVTVLRQALDAERGAAHVRFVKELRSPRYTRMCERLADPLLRRALPATDAGCDALKMIAPLAKSVRKAGKLIARESPPPLFHRLRVRIKRLRYGLEMLAEMGGKRLRKALVRLEDMQELLGVHQDLVATMAWLRTYAANANGAAPETLMAVGAILQALTERREKFAARACRRWRKIVRSGLLDDALEEISDAAQQHLRAVAPAAAEVADPARIDAEQRARTAEDPPSDAQGSPAVLTVADPFTAVDGTKTAPESPIATPIAPLLTDG